MDENTREASSGWTIPSSPEDRRKIKDGLAEIGNSLTRIAGERENIKAIREDLKERFEMPPKLTNKLAKTLWLDSFRSEVGEQEEFRDAFEVLVSK